MYSGIWIEISFILFSPFFEGCFKKRLKILSKKLRLISTKTKTQLAVPNPCLLPPLTLRHPFKNRGRTAETSIGHGCANVHMIIFAKKIKVSRYNTYIYM